MTAHALKPLSGKNPPPPPAPGETREIAPGVLWIRMPLPISLDHINLWAIEDGDGWTLIDCGINCPEAIETWERIAAHDLGGRPVKRVIVTHMHPDHAGLAGWLARRFDCPLWMTRAEHRAAKAMLVDDRDDPRVHAFYRAAGWSPEETARYFERRAILARFYAALPDAFETMRDGSAFDIGGRRWTVIVGGGHSPEHACLHCPELGLFISGDMVLPAISPNVSAPVDEPETDAIGDWLAALARIRARVPDSVLVLPSHGQCFHGLHARIDALDRGQRDALARLAAALDAPARADALFGVLFSRPIRRADTPLMTLATGETVALLHHLVANGTLAAETGEDGVTLYRRAGGAAAA